MSDPIADMLAQVSNANHKFKDTVDVVASKIKVEIARVLKEEGFISHYKVIHDKHRGTIRLTLKYTSQKERIIQGVKRISRPGVRIYRKWTDIPSLRNGLGMAILSTSKGVMSGQKAREKRLGGELLCSVW